MNGSSISDGGEGMNDSSISYIADQGRQENEYEWRM